MMPNARTAGWAISIVLLLNRLSLGLYLFLAGYRKVFILGPGDFYREGFLTMKPDWLPIWFAAPYGYAIPFAELIGGAMLVLGLFTPVVAAIIGLLIFSFTVALVTRNGTLVHGPGPFTANLIMISLAMLLTLTGAGRISIDALIGGKGGARRG
ncbi:MAG: DoxX family protein [Phycisphaeraceae bacterium]